MFTDRIKATNINLVVDGKNVEIKNATKQNMELNNDLLDADKFQDFVKDPKSFVSRYQLELDDEVSKLLKERLKDVKKIEEVYEGLVNPIDEVGATVWAIASPAYSVSTSKVAVAFHPVDLRFELRSLRHLKQLRPR